ncbi:MAG: CAP domain-containing protein [Hyphomicrobiales bacterium]
MRLALMIFAAVAILAATGCQSRISGSGAAPMLAQTPVMAQPPAARDASEIKIVSADGKKVIRHDAQAARLINAYRAKNRLGPVRVNEMLTRAAIAHAREISSTEVISHYGANGNDPAQRVRLTGYRFVSIGENISAGRPKLSAVIKAWIASPSHEVNLVLSPAVDFGLAHVVAKGSKYTDYWVLVIGAPGKRSPLQMRIGG